MFAKFVRNAGTANRQFITLVKATPDESYRDIYLVNQRKSEGSHLFR